MNFWSDKITSFSGIKTLKCGDKMLNIDKPLVMGILNLTPDSFFDGGRYSHPADWIKQTEIMVGEGASIIDLGAVSSRPGAKTVSENEEIARLLPALELLKSEFPETVFSVDTFRAGVAKLAAEAGAGIINDISCGKMDPEMITAVAETGLPYVLMHMQGVPKDMQLKPDYENVVGEINQFFSTKFEFLQMSGINQIILDPGFGFGKTIKHNYTILHELTTFSQSGLPLLVGISRKSMIYKLLETSPEQILSATSALHMLAILNGANILRVHDVKEAIQIIKLCEAYKNSVVA